ncbi:MAG: hypothetical protein AAF664_21510 [Planctomycetota bacterium]
MHVRFSLVAGFVICLLVESAFSDQLTRLTANPSFEPSTAGWNGDNAVVSLRPQSSPRDNFVSLETRGAFAQWVVISDEPGAAHIVAIKARRASSSWAGFGVTYLDIFGNQIGSFEQEISEGAARTSESFGAFVPADAIVAVIWVYNSTSTAEVVEFDDFELLRVEPGSDASTIFIPFGITSDPIVPEGVDGTIWLSGDREGVAQASFTFAGGPKQPPFTRPAVSAGQSNSTTVLFQQIDLVAGQEYLFQVPADNPSGAFAAVGIDFFNEAGTEVDEVLIPVVEGRSSSGTNLVLFTVPAETTSAFFWVYVPPTPQPIVFPQPFLSP